MIRKSGNKHKVLSESKGKDGKYKSLGTYKTRKEAENRLRQVEYFKRQK